MDIIVRDELICIKWTLSVLCKSFVVVIVVFVYFVCLGYMVGGIKKNGDCYSWVNKIVLNRNS